MQREWDGFREINSIWCGFFFLFCFQNESASHWTEKKKPVSIRLSFVPLSGLLLCFSLRQNLDLEGERSVELVGNLQRKRAGMEDVACVLSQWHDMNSKFKTRRLHFV